MNKDYEIKFSLVVLISLFLHIFLGLILILPYYDDLYKYGAFLKKLAERRNSSAGVRDITVNINPDNISDLKSYTLLSDVTSKEKGHITEQKGDNWLNNSQDFRVKRGVFTPAIPASVQAKKSASQNKSVAQASSSEDSLEVAIEQGENILPENKPKPATTGDQGDSEWTKIPDKLGIDKKNALFYTSDGMFSFNTAKFKDFEYFRGMKNKISQNWFPPVGANMILPGVANASGGYTPGYTRIMIIPSQEVKLYFTMDRSGKVLDVVVLESRGNKSLDDSCVDSIKNSKDFGTVPEDIKGDVVVIPFIFGYYIY